MTSTSINQGINEGAKPSSNDGVASDTDIVDRVLRPPGGGSSDIFGTGVETQVAPSPSRARAPPSNNIFGGYEEAPPASAEKPKHDRMKSNVFGGGDPDSAPGSARKSSKTYESRVFGETESNQNKSDDEKEKDKENGEENNGETENNNDTKSAAPAKSKGDSVYNPISGELNIGQADPATSPNTRLSSGRLSGGRARGEYNEYNRDNSFSISAQEDPALRTTQSQPRGFAHRPADTPAVFSADQDPEALRASTRRINADVSNPITGETKSFAIGGAGEKVNRPSSRVLQPPGGASTKLW